MSGPKGERKTPAYIDFGAAFLWVYAAVTTIYWADGPNYFWQIPITMTLVERWVFPRYVLNECLLGRGVTTKSSGLAFCLWRQQALQWRRYRERGGWRGKWRRGGQRGRRGGGERRTLLCLAWRRRRSRCGAVWCGLVSLAWVGLL